MTEPASKILKAVSIGCLLIGLSSFWGISQFHHLDSTIDGVGFLFMYVFVGVVLSVPFYVLIYRLVPDLKGKQRVSKQWTSNLAGLGMGFFFLTPAIASYINRTHLISQDRCGEYKIIRKGSSGNRNREYYFFVVINSREERLTVFKPYWEKFQEGEVLILCLQKGILGYEYINLPD